VNINTHNILTKLAIVIFLTTSLTIDLHAQRAGKAYRTGKQAFENKEYIRAIGWLSIAIEAQKSKFDDAYFYRAESYRAMNRIEDAIKDYIAASRLFPDRADITKKTARLLYNQGKYNEALQFATSTLDIDTTNFDAQKIQSLALTHMGNAESGLMISDQAIQIKKDAEALYAKALASDSLGLHDYAIAYYNEAITINKGFKPPYHDMGRLLVRTGYIEKAIEIFTQASKVFNDPESYRLRSILYGAKGNIMAQISDITKILTLEPTRIDLYFERAEQYRRVNLFQNALSDITYYIKWDPESATAWLLKGQLLEKLLMISKAIESYEKVLEYSNLANQTEYANTAIFRLKKEKYPPKISITAPPLPDENSISLGKNQTQVVIKGTIIDASKIDDVRINGKKPKLVNTNGEVSFSTQLITDTLQTIRITATDAYNNTTSKSYKLLRVEKEPPLLFLQSPKLNSDSTISTAQSRLSIKGFFHDASGLKLLHINGKKIETQKIDDKYYFEDKLDATNSDSIIVKASDYFSNQITYKFKLIHNNRLSSFESPLGKTWYALVVTDSIQSILPEIREYKKKLINELKNYNLDSLIIINHPSKDQLERKLIFDLPEATRQNRVEAIILHVIAPGYTKGEFSYWITPKQQDKKPYDLLNTSILRTYFNANKLIKYNTVISESVSVGSNIFEPIDNSTYDECHKIQNLPNNGQFILNIKVDDWHNYASPYLNMLSKTSNSNIKCFSAKSLLSIKNKNISGGSFRGTQYKTFPVIIYLKE
jgi:tetratricopeptide (TPR) repeat protein